MAQSLVDPNIYEQRYSVYITIDTVIIYQPGINNFKMSIGQVSKHNNL